MNNAVKATLLCTLGMGCSPVVSAGQEERKSPLGSGHLDITLKNVWMLNATNAMADDGIGPQNAWAQGVHLDYRSDWYNDWLAGDISWYGVTKLYANRSFAGRNLLRNNRGHAEGFNKVGQLYAKTRWGNETQSLAVKAGWHQLYKFGFLNVTRSRAAPSSWQGISAEARYQHLTARGALVNRFSERDTPDKRRFTSLSGNKRINYLISGDLRWQPEKGRAVTLLAGESQHYLRRLGLEVDWTLPLTDEQRLLMRGVLYQNQGLAAWEGKVGFTQRAWHLYAQMALATDNHETGAGWSVTRAPVKNNHGRFYWHFGKNTRAAFNSKADANNDYVNDGEQMLHLYSHYQFSPQWLAGIYAYYGFRNRYNNVPLHQSEYGGMVTWKPASVSGLKVIAGLGPSFSWKLSQGKPALTASGSDFRRSRGVGGGLTVDYQHRLF